MASSPHFVHACEDTHPRLIEAAFAKAKLEQEGRPAPHPFIDGFKTAPVLAEATLYEGERYVSLANALSFLGVNANHFFNRIRSRHVYVRSVANPSKGIGKGRKARYYSERDLILFKDLLAAPLHLRAYHIPGRRSRYWRDPPRKQQN